MIYKKIRRNFTISILFVIIFVACVTHSIEGEEEFDYDPLTVETGCDCNEATVGILDGEDWSQNWLIQAAAWLVFHVDTYPGLVDSDWRGPRTATYNCHSEVYRNGIYWLNDYDIDEYHGTNPGCWKAVSSGGSILSYSVHSCFITDNRGKCGDKFSCINNQHVYGDAMPTQRYEKQY